MDNVNYKVQVKDSSEATRLQEHLLKKGIIWLDGTTDVCHVKYRDYYYIEDGTFGFGADRKHFKEYPLPEVTLQEILSGDIQEKSKIDWWYA